MLLHILRGRENHTEVDGKVNPEPAGKGNSKPAGKGNPEPTGKSGAFDLWEAEEKNLKLK